MAEEYREIPGFKGIYVASIKTGEIRSVDRYQDYVGGRGNVPHRRFLRGKVRKPTLTSSDKKHYSVTLSIDGKTKTYGVQQLVAKAFPEICGEWFEGCEVHHKDFNPANNAPHNLQVVTKQQHLELHKNNQVKCLKKFEKGHTPCNKKLILVYTTDLERVIGCYNSATEAAKSLNCSQSLVTLNCNGKVKTCKGFYCEYI